MAGQENSKKHISQHTPRHTVAEMEDEDAVERDWPPELLRMILCRIPFPPLLKLQGISRTWKEVLLSALHSATLEGRLFQADVLAATNRWPQFCPVFVTMEPYYHIWGFDQSTTRWQQIYKPVRRSFPNPNRVGQTQQTVLFGQVSSTLMCLVQRIENPLYIYLRKPQLLEVMVLNVFTGDYKVLPPLMEAEVGGDQELMATIYRFFPDLENIYLGLRCPNDFVFTFDPESRGYKVYLLYESVCREENERLQQEQNEGDLRGILMFEYLSTTGAWKAILSIGQRNSEKFKISLNTGSTAYLDGVLYTLSLEPMRVWRYYLDDASETSEAEHFCSDIFSVEINLLHAWGIVEVSQVLMVAIVVDAAAYVFQVDKNTLEWTTVASRVIARQERKRKRKRKEGSSTESEVGNEAELKKKRMEDSPSDAKEEEESSKGTSTESETAVRKEGSKSKDDDKRNKGPKIKCPRYQVVSDSRCIYFWPYYASGEEVLVYDVIDSIWSGLGIPRMRTGGGLQLLAGCSRPGDGPFTSV